MDKASRIYIAGSEGMVGKALASRLTKQSYVNLLLPSRGTLDLCDASAVSQYFAEERPDYVFLLAARVGGIQENIRHPASMGVDNTRIAINVMEASAAAQVSRLLYFGSSCMYPIASAHERRGAFQGGARTDKRNVRFGKALCLAAL